MAFYNVSKIENWFDDFTSCKNKFINTYYDDYQDSYIRTCNDEIIRKMKTQLDNHYNKIKRIYNRINDHWSNYLNDLKNIDNCIAGTSNPFSVYAPAPAAKLNSLPCLKEYEANLATKIESFSGYIGTVTFLGWSEDKDTSENLLYIFERTGATVGTAVVSVIEGIGMFGEGIVDVCTTVVSECYCQVRLAVDDDFTEKQADIIRESTRDVVSTQYVKNKFDSFYQESDVGAYLSENAYAFDAVRSIGNEVGIVVGAVVVSSLTQGAIPPSVLYGISKAGNHIEENFQDENNGYFESIVKGGLAGALDGVFFAAGAKGDQVLKATIGKSAAKNLFAFGGKMGYEAFCAVSQDGSNIVLDSLFMDNQIVDNNGNTIYFENYKDKLSYCYEQAGGKEAIIESLVTSVVLSGMSDGVDTIKAVRNIDAGSNIKATNNIDLGSDDVKKSIKGVNSKKVEISFNSKDINANANLDYIKKEYDELMNWKNSEEGLYSKRFYEVNGNKYGTNNRYKKNMDRLSELEKILSKNNQSIENKSVNTNDIKINQPSFDSKEISSKIYKYITENRDKPINIKKILEDNNIKVSIDETSTDFDLAIEMGDPNLYYISVLKRNGIDTGSLKLGKGLQFNSAGLEQIAQPYLNKTDLLNLQKIKSKFSKINLSDNQRATFFQFQECGGYEIAAYLRGKKGGDIYRWVDNQPIYFLNEWEDLPTLENTINNAKNNIGSPRTKIEGESFIDTMNMTMEEFSNDTVIEGVSYYSSMNTVYQTDNIIAAINKYGANSKEVMDLLNASKGIEITDSSFSSRTIPPTKKTKYSENPNSKIEVRTYILPGCGTYIDSISNRYALGEMLLKPNCKQVTVDAFIDPKTNRIVFETVCFPPDELGLSYVNLFGANKNGLSIEYINQEIKRTGLDKKIDSAITEMHTKKLYDGKKSIAYHDYEHVENVTKYAMYIAKKLNLTPLQQSIIKDCAIYHDVGVVENLKYENLGISHTGHSTKSAIWAGDDLSNKYSLDDLNKIKAIIELHEKTLNENNIVSVCKKYGITNLSDIKEIEQLAPILKDADALDRTRFPGGSEGLDPNRLKTNVAKHMVKGAYQNSEQQASKIISNILSSQNLPKNEYDEVIKLKSSGKYPDRVILFAMQNYKNQNILKQIYNKTGKNINSISQYADYIINNKTWI